MAYLGIGGYFTGLTYVLCCVNGANMSLVCGLQYDLLVKQCTAAIFMLYEQQHNPDIVL